MSSRPHHEIYQDNMILKKHGFPQFSADPEGNSSLGTVDGVKQVQLGDLGYFSYATISFDMAGYLLNIVTSK